MTRGLYFLGAVPDPPVSDEIHAFKLKVASDFGSKKSLGSPPHITLFPPFRSDEGTVSKVWRQLQTEFEKFPAFRIELDGFGTFRRDVLYVRPIPDTRLAQLESVVRRTCRSNGLRHPNPGRPFTPHITIGLRDFTHENFLKAKTHFFDNGYRRTAVISTVTVFRHDGKQWFGEKLITLRRIELEK